MSVLARRNPFYEINDMVDTFNRFFDQLWRSQGLIDDCIPLDVIESEDGYTVKASLPGMNLDDLEVTFGSNVLTIKGELRADDGDQHHVHLKERWSGPFQRSLTLPETIDVDGIQANYEAGVLSLFLPKREEARPRRIQINPGAQPEMIEERVAETA